MKHSSESIYTRQTSRLQMQKCRSREKQDFMRHEWIICHSDPKKIVASAAKRTRETHFRDRVARIALWFQQRARGLKEHGEGRPVSAANSEAQSNSLRQSTQVHASASARPPPLNQLSSQKNMSF